MNQEQFIAYIARMKGNPDDMEWAVIHQIAKELTVENTINVIEAKYIKANDCFGLKSLNYDMLRSINPASRSDSRQCSPH